ncbi:MAG: TIGR03936 family radical SAM-associated protein [Microthrixaceae bacterium]
MSVVPNERVRIRYAVSGKIRFLSHRDVARVLERAIRRAGIPVAYSQGYSPRPKVQYGLALSTGYESDGEYIDIELDADRQGERDPVAIGEALAECMPRGLEVQAAAGVPHGQPSLQDSVMATAWEVLIEHPDPEELVTRAAGMLASQEYEIEIVRKGKQVREDLRPLLGHLEVLPATEEPTLLRVELGTKPRSIRPAELLEALGVTEPLLVRRTHQWTDIDAGGREPLPLRAKGLRDDRFEDIRGRAEEAEDRRFEASAPDTGQSEPGQSETGQSETGQSETGRAEAVLG